MSKPRYKWWGYVLNVIRAYPKQSGRAIPDPHEAREHMAVTQAQADTLRMEDGEARMTIVELVDWRRSHTMEGAAQRLHLSYRTVRRKHTEFILLVAWHLGLYGGEMEDRGHGKNGLPV